MWSMRIGISVAFFLALGTPTLVHAQSDETTALAGMSDIIFTGTVLDVAAVSFDEVPASDRTVVVDVTAVHLAPDVLSIAEGDRITVALRDPGSLRQGSHATFYATGWILGGGVAVREVGYRIVDGDSETSPLASARLEAQEAQLALADARLVEKLRLADAVVVGRVTQIQVDIPTALIERPIRITEHDPEWREAVVVVESGLKGAEDGEEIVVRFPASFDIRWYAAPKFEPGQEATLILQEDAVSGFARAIRGAAQVPAYTALAEQDVLAADDAGRIGMLLALTR